MKRYHKSWWLTVHCVVLPVAANNLSKPASRYEAGAAVSRGSVRPAYNTLPCEQNQYLHVLVDVFYVSLVYLQIEIVFIVVIFVLCGVLHEVSDSSEMGASGKRCVEKWLFLKKNGIKILL